MFKKLTDPMDIVEVGDFCYEVRDLLHDKFKDMWFLDFPRQSAWTNQITIIWKDGPSLVDVSSFLKKYENKFYFSLVRKEEY
jgi:hypothetical protein